MGTRSFRCKRILNSSLVKRFEGVRRDMLVKGMLVSGDSREGR
jgi:hypothetical protein